MNSPYHDDGSPVTIDEYQLVNHMCWIKCTQTKKELEDPYGWIDVSYQIRLGKYTLESKISEWTTDWDRIRHDVEHLIWHDKTEIQLNFEDSPTRILLSKEKALDLELEKIKGTGFAWIPLMKMVVIPNSFIKDIEPFVGYDKYFDVLRSIYYGLQSLANAYPETNEENPEMTRNNVRSKLTSPLMDKYIEDILFDRLHI